MSSWKAPPSNGIGCAVVFIFIIIFAILSATGLNLFLVFIFTIILGTLIAFWIDELHYKQVYGIKKVSKKQQMIASEIATLEDIRFDYHIKISLLDVDIGYEKARIDGTKEYLATIVNDKVSEKYLEETIQELQKREEYISELKEKQETYKKKYTEITDEINSKYNH